MRLPEFIKRDWSRKLVAVFMAVIIWVTVHQQLQVTSTLRDVTVRVTTSPDLIMLEQERLRVRVTVRGSRRRVPNITSADIRVEAHVVEINDRKMPSDRLPISSKASWPDSSAATSASSRTTPISPGRNT